MGGSAVAESDALLGTCLAHVIAGLFTGACLRLLYRAAKASPRGLFVFAATLPFFYFLPRENQFFFLVPLLKAMLFAGLDIIIAKVHARNQPKVTLSFRPTSARIYWLRTIRTYLQAEVAQLVLVDDCSPDDTPEVARQLMLARPANYLSAQRGEWQTDNSEESRQGAGNYRVCLLWRR